VTHLVSNRDGKLTIKVANALAKCVPIVTASYLVDYVKCLQSKQVLPDPANYTPVMKESFLNPNEAKLGVNNARRSVFGGKTFAFATSKQAEKYQAAIRYGGGKILMLGDPTFKPTSFANPNNVMIVNPDAVNDAKWKAALAKVHSVGYSPIPEPQIAMAILLASCNNNCNPEYKIKLMNTQRSTQSVTQPSTLAPETQSTLEQSEICKSFHSCFYLHNGYRC